MKRVITLIILSLAIITNQAFSEQFKYFKAKAMPSKLQINEGEKFNIQVEIVLKKDLHTFALKDPKATDENGPIPTEIALLPENALKIAGKITGTKPKVEYDEIFEMKVGIYVGKVIFNIPAQAKKNIDFNKDKLYVNAYMQICLAEGCIPPEDYKFLISNETYTEGNETQDSSSVQAETKLDTINTSTQESNTINTGQDSTQATKEKEQTKSEKQESQSIWATILISMASGAAALLMPCVFPMVPITVSFFTRRAEKTKGKGLRDALVYALGIIITFTALGFIFSLIFGASGIQDFVKNPWVSLFIALIFLSFALSLFGAFEIQVPTSILNKLNAKSQKGEGVGSVILMGLTFSLASFSCTGPLVAGALGAAASGEWFYPIVSMASFSLVLSAPFFLLALFPMALNKMPKAGAWMNNIKVVLAFIIIMAVLEFLNVSFTEWGFPISRGIYLGIWVTCTALSTLYILGIFKMMHDAPVERVGIVRLLFVIIFGTLTIYFLSGLFGNSLGEFEAFLPSPEKSLIVGTNSTQSSESNQWLEDFNQALSKAKETGKNIFLDISGEHCPNCRWMERNIFTIPEIQSAMNEMIKVKLITDVKKEPYISNKQFAKERFGIDAIPYYVIISPDDKVIAVETATRDKQKYLDFLKKGKR